MPLWVPRRKGLIVDPMINGIQRLVDTPITLNGLTPTRMFTLDGKDPTASAWVTRAHPVVPVTFNVAGTTAFTLAQPAPFIGGQDVGVKFAGTGAVGDNTKHFVAPDNTGFNPGLLDGWIEIALRTPAALPTTVSYILFKQAVASYPYWAAQLTPVAGALYFDLYLSVGAAGLSSYFRSAAIPLGADIFATAFWNRDEASASGAAWNIDGVAGAGADISARSASDITITDAPFRVGSASGTGIYAFGGRLYYASAAMASGLIAAGAGGKTACDALSLKRFQLLTGATALRNDSGSIYPSSM